jgi:hypothetical protein
MGQTAVLPTDDLRAIINKSGANEDGVSYDPAAGFLSARDKSDAELTAARDAVRAGTDVPTVEDRDYKTREISAAALKAHHDAILVADTVYQAKLAEIAAARDIKTLEAITYP